MNNYKKRINRLLICAFIFIGLTLYILDILDLFEGGRYLSLMICFLIIYDFVKFYIKGVISVTFNDNEYVTLEKYKFFKYEKVRFNISSLKYKYIKCISYPNKYYKLFFVNEQNEILINTSGGEFISFSEPNEKEIIQKLDELNIPKMK